MFKLISMDSEGQRSSEASGIQQGKEKNKWYILWSPAPSFLPGLR